MIWHVNDDWFLQLRQLRRWIKLHMLWRQMLESTSGRCYLSWISAAMGGGGERRGRVRRGWRRCEHVREMGEIVGQKRIIRIGNRHERL